MFVLLSCGEEPVGPAPPASALRYRAIDAGYYHTCALALEGRAYCWGRNDFGTLGDGTRRSRSRPVAVASGRTLRTLDAGAGHNCALAADDTAWCWGHNDEGQLGDGGFTLREQPTAVAGGHAFTAVSAGHAHSCGLSPDGSAFCWGDDSRGQLGDGGPGGPARSAVPVRVQSPARFAAVIAGYYQTCAIAVGGAAYCWGANESGQLGDGTTADRQVPVAVIGGRTFGMLAAGDRFACAAGGSAVYCWGANRAGELGRAGGASPQPIGIPGVTGVTSLVAAAGASTVPGASPYACAVTTGAAALCWGGAVRDLRSAGAQPATLSAAHRAGALAAGAQHVCLLDHRGYAWCGGGNYAGQLGDGTTADRNSLVGVLGPDS